MKDYITESAFVKILQDSFDGYAVTPQFKLGRKRIDCVVSANDRILFGFEFDGFQHYTLCSQIYRDMDVREWFKTQGAYLVRWPYWLQPNSETIAWAFGEYAKNIAYEETMYPNGFISREPSCILPGDFCALGLERFKEEFNSLPPTTRLQVLDSLEARSTREAAAKEALKYLRG